MSYTPVIRKRTFVTPHAIRRRESLFTALRTLSAKDWLGAGLVGLGLIILGMFGR